MTEPEQTPEAQPGTRTRRIQFQATAQSLPPVAPHPLDSPRLPSTEQLAVIRAEARSSGTLSDLRQLSAAWEEVAKKCDMAFEELFRLAVFRLEVERDLGAELARRVRRGGDRRKYARSTLLPESISRNQSAAYQKLAAIPEDAFHKYIAGARKARKVPSSRGARLCASVVPHRTAATPATRGLGKPVVPRQVLEACVRCLGTIDVLVGVAPIKAQSKCANLAGLAGGARGALLVVEPGEPSACLRQLAQLRGAGQIDDAIVVLPRDLDADWWSSLGGGAWSLCLPNDRRSPIVGHIGAHGRGFVLVFGQLGVVAGVQQSMGMGSCD